MNRALTLAWLAGATLGFAFTTREADAAQRPDHAVRAASVLKGVKELEKPVTYTETKIPLGELVQKVAHDTGVPLTTAKDVSDEPVAVVVKDLPARELLEQLSDLLDYIWSRQGRAGAWRYEISQDLAGRQREEALRQSVLGDVEKQLRQELRRYADMAALSSTQIQGVLDAEQKHQDDLEKLPSEQKARLLRSPEERERKRRRDTAQKLTSPVARSLAVLLGRLPAAQWDILRQEKYLYFSTDPEAGELPLPAEMARAFRAAQPTMYPPSERVSFSSPQQEESLRKQEKQGQDLWGSATGYRVQFKLDDRAYRTRGMLIVQAEALPLRGGVSDQAERVNLTGLSTKRLFLYGVPEDARQFHAGDELLRADLDQDPLLGAIKPFKAEVKPRPRAGRPGNIRLRLRDLLPDLARTYGASFVMDAYWSAPAAPAGQSLGGESIALHTLLDRLAAPSHRWERHGRLIRLRSRTWFFDRPREIPLRYVRHWNQVYAERGGLPLEEYLGMVAVLNEEQLNSLADLAADGEIALDINSPYSARDVLRLYAALSPAQRQALERGQALAVAQMTPLQQKLFLAALKNPNRYQAKPVNLEQWARGSVSLSTRRTVSFRSPNGTTMLIPAGPDGKPDPRMLAAMRQMVQDGPLPTPGPGMSRPFLQLVFRLDYGPQDHHDTMINVAAP